MEEDFEYECLDDVYAECALSVLREFWHPALAGEVCGDNLKEQEEEQGAGEAKGDAVVADADEGGERCGVAMQEGPDGRGSADGLEI